MQLVALFVGLSCLIDVYVRRCEKYILRLTNIYRDRGGEMQKRKSKVDCFCLCHRGNLTHTIE